MSASRAPPANHRILYVEDEDENWRVMKLRLGEDYDLVRASTADEALNILGMQPPIAAILMDIELKGSSMDGIELTRLLRSTAPSSGTTSGVPRFSGPVFFVTAYAARYDEQELLAAGGDRLLTKPVQFVSLSLALSSTLAKRVSASLTR